MSNHHPPGNEWYRHLIRSNRPLYGACPKHTKLLVAKAIVQAVEQQEGRFFERDLKSGFWYRVPYKRVVDKTSHGLGIRDESPSEPTSHDHDAGQVYVPESFSGKSNVPPNLEAWHKSPLTAPTKPYEDHSFIAAKPGSSRSNLHVEATP
jgi:hypothetical protein